MEIFVSEKDMPKSCLECQNENCDHQYIECCYEDRHQNCPLKSLEQHDKELLQEFGKELLSIWDFTGSTNLDNLGLKTTEAFDLINKGYQSCRKKVEDKINELLKERGV